MKSKAYSGHSDLGDDRCGSCPGCEIRAAERANTLSGFPLVFCAFAVFVAPLLAAAAGSSAAYYYSGAKGFTIAAGFAAAGVAVAAARPLTGWVIQRSKDRTA